MRNKKIADGIYAVEMSEAERIAAYNLDPAIDHICKLFLNGEISEEEFLSRYRLHQGFERADRFRNGLRKVAYYGVAFTSGFYLATLLCGA